MATDYGFCLCAYVAHNRRSADAALTTASYILFPINADYF